MLEFFKRLFGSCFSLHPPDSNSEVPFRLASWSLGGSSGAGYICLVWMCGARGNQEGEWKGTEHFQKFLIGKKNWTGALSCHCEGKFIALYLSVGSMKCSCWLRLNLAYLLCFFGEKWEDQGLLSGRYHVPLCIGYFLLQMVLQVMQRGMGHSYFFLCHFEKCQDISLQAIPWSPLVPIHMFKGRLARRLMYSIGCRALPGPTS